MPKKLTDKVIPMNDELRKKMLEDYREDEEKKSSLKEGAKRALRKIAKETPLYEYLYKRRREDG